MRWHSHRPGLSVTGVDVSAGMLALARRKSERLAAAASRCLTFVEGDHGPARSGAAFRRGLHCLPLVSAPADRREQWATLTGVRRHLARTGGWPSTRLILVSIYWPTKTRLPSGSPVSISRRSAAITF
jgi:hypothetical protein